MRRLLLSLALLVAPLMGQTRPLLLEGADHLSVSKSEGVILLQGNVRFKHDEARFTTSRAQWDRTHDLVKCQGGFHYLSNDGELRAQSGLYERKSEQVTAEGAAELRDSLNQTLLYGNQVVYQRKEEKARAVGNARLVFIEADSSQKGVLKWDTLVITAQRFEVDRKEKTAKALRDVFVTRGDLRVWCDTGIYRWEEGVLNLLGAPRASVGDVDVSGEKMRVEMEKNERKLKRIRVEVEARGKQRALDVETNGFQNSEVDGDTIEAWFNGKEILAFEARGEAAGRFYPENRDQMVDQVKGDFLRLDFKQGEPDQGVVRGGAKTLYYHFDEERLEGRNEALGEVVFLGFDQKKLKTIRLGGAGRGKIATGIYYGEVKEPRKEVDETEGQNNLDREPD